MAKSESAQARGRGRLLAILEGRPCPSCAEGTLERGRYKGNLAVVCNTCGTPRAQVWSVSSD
ncbi:HVO_A0556 family zinc finger protein [Natrinema gelatinilyticum]|uniref:HVO_A0556 family zinc finger protein n=1 Tax=Natrinema gelatinilyticum TaxID=2961571 RepID=UPI0020C42F55|nr:HVO_A0556 family zinc finger protein [Natrinema gelatinilyticum]